MPDVKCRKDEGISHLAFRISHLLYLEDVSTGSLHGRCIVVAFHIMYSFGLYYPYDNNNNNDFFGLEIMKRVDGQNG
jgi:hypothetical protein